MRCTTPALSATGTPSIASICCPLPPSVRPSFYAVRDDGAFLFSGVAQIGFAAFKGKRGNDPVTTEIR